ncbi:APC family permease [Photobacterium phosphoreum]|uniref:APC family permease n=1 Tax=Photobacterium phosphoreum TaxID=659 RepID=UPI0039AECE92
MSNIATPNKKISLFSAVALSATCMVGSGWLFSSQLAAKEAGNWAFLAWVLAALLVLSVGMCLSKVVAIYPVRGATTRSSSLSHNNVFGMPFSFANWFGIMVTVATEAQATTQYLSAAIDKQSLMGDDGLTLNGKLLALGILVLYLVINYYGVKLLAKINNVITVLKVFTPLFTIGVLMLAHFDTSNFHLATTGGFGAGSAITAIVGAGLIYSFNGFQTTVAFASEIKDPTRNIPKAIIYSIGIVLTLYLCLQFAFMGAIPHEVLANGWASLNFSSPLMNLAILLGINFLAILLVADSVVSPSGTGYAYLGSASRMLYAMAKEGQMPRWIAKLCPVYNFSKRSMIINFILTALVLWNAKSWASLMVVVTGYHIIGYMAAPVSMSALKPKTKAFGLVVFTCLGMIMTTIPSGDLLMMNISLSILVLVFWVIQRKQGFAHLLLFSAPFMIYLWLLYISPNWIVSLALSIAFFLFVTNQKYVDFCKKEKEKEKEKGKEEIVGEEIA